MFFVISLIAALVGLVLAGLATWMPDTGITGSPGAYLVVLGALMVVVSLSVILGNPSRGLRAGFVAAVIVSAILTALASWFLMQNGIVASMAIAVFAVLVNGARSQKRGVP